MYHSRALLAAILSTIAGLAYSAEQAELAKQAQNPVAHLVSVPFQNNLNFGVGPDQDAQYVLNVQPVIPFELNADWSLITRTIIPVIYQPELAPGIGDSGGLGDVELSLFLSPSHSGRITWGVGPVFVLPTASKDFLGTGRYSIGASAVALASSGPWLIGALINNVTSVSSRNGRRNVNQLLLQPFVNYNLPRGWYLTSSPLITADWEAESNERWVVPLGGGFGRVFRIGTQAMNVQLQAFDNVAHPDRAADWSLRFQFQLLFPK